jgi:hypothetical protein
MGAIRQLVISDLHLGALNSLFTNVTADGRGVNPAEPAPVTQSLGEALCALSADRAPPQLVILGDLLELALTPLPAAAYTLRDFLRAAKVGQANGAFGSTIRYVAGNHDHYLWSRARTDHDLALLDATSPGEPLPKTTHVTRTFPADEHDGIEGRFVASLARWAEPDASVSVVHSYPNFGLADADGRRAVVMHHGHFVERLYRIVSVLDEFFDADTDAAPTSAHLERDNGGWIDFFWSSEGDSGDAGSDVRRLYESLASGQAIDAELDRIADVLLARRRGVIGRVEAWGAKGALRSLHRALAWRERHLGHSVLSKDAERGLSMYLQGPVRHGIQRERDSLPSETTFVFGHTHKPFTGSRGVAGFPRPVQIVNTGGWVVDHESPEPNKGAIAVAIDDELHVATLHLFQQRADGTAAPIAVSGLTPNDAEFARQLTAEVARHRAEWDEFTARVSESLRARRAQLELRERDTIRRVKAAGG